MRRGSDNKGFTLTELMVTLAIVGILVALAVPYYRGMLPHIRIKAAVRDVATGMHLARLTAISKNMPQTIQFDYVDDGFAYGSINTLSSGSGWHGIDLYDETSLSYMKISATDPTPVPNLDSHKITFKSDGTADMPGDNEAVYMRHKEKTNEVYRIRVEKNSGIIKVESWQSVNWKSE